MRKLRNYVSLLSMLLIVTLLFSSCDLITGGESKDDDISVNAAEDLLDDGEIDDAIDMLEEIVSDDDEDYEAWKLLVEAYIEDEEFEDAADVLEDMGKAIADNYDEDDDDIADAMEDYEKLAEDLMDEDDDIDLASIMSLIDSETSNEDDEDNEDEDRNTISDNTEREKPEDAPELASVEKEESKPSGKPGGEDTGNKIEIDPEDESSEIIASGSGIMGNSSSASTNDNNTATSNDGSTSDSNNTSTTDLNYSTAEEAVEDNDDIYFMGEVNPGDILETYLYPATYDLYEFIPSWSGDFVIGTIGSIDTYGEIFDDDVDYYEYNDDDGDDFNFLLSSYLEAGMSYYIAVSGYNASEEGYYSLYVFEDEGGEGTDVYDMGPLYVDSEVSTTLVTNSVDAYTFTPSWSGYYYITTIGNTDTYGQIYDTNYDYYVYDDDSGDNTNFLMEAYLESGITYYVDVMGYDSTIQGDYTIYVMDASDSVETETDLYEMGPLYLGDVFETYIVAGAVDRYEFTPSLDGYYTIGTIGETDTYGEIYDANFNYYDSNDDGGDNGNFIFNAYLEASVTYYIDISGYFSDTAGDYGVYISESGSSDVYTDGEVYDMGPIYLGDYLGSYLYPNSRDIYQFTPSFSGNYYIGTLGDMDTYGEIYDGNSYYDYNDDGGDIGNFMFYDYLEAGITYYIDVFAYYSEDEGSYTLYVEQETVNTNTEDSNGEIYDMGPLYEGDYVPTYLYPNSVDQYNFTPSQSGYYYIGTASEIDTYGEIYDADFNYYDTNDDGGDNSDFMFYAYLEATITYYIDVTGYYSDTEGDYIIYVVAE